MFFLVCCFNYFVGLFSFFEFSSFFGFVCCVFLLLERAVWYKIFLWESFHFVICF